MPVGAITPRGWLLEQLKLQAEGLSGHLAMFYPSIAESWWVGGTEDQGGMIYQQAPYWLNGFLPLAYQLRNAGVDVLYPKCGLAHKHTDGSAVSASSHGNRHHLNHPHADVQGDGEPGAHGGPVVPVGPVNPLEQVKTYIDGIMDRVQPDGWVGPPTAAVRTWSTWYLGT